MALGAGMGLVIDLGQVAEIQVGIDLRGAEIGMAQQLLHGAQIAGTFQHMGGKAVAQLVRVNMGRELLAQPPLFKTHLDGARRQPPLLLAQKQGPLLSGQQGRTQRQPLLQPLQRHAPDGQQPLLVALADHPYLTGGQIQMFQIQGHQLGETQTGGVKQLHDGPIPHRQQIAGIRDIEQLIDLIHIQILGQRLGLFGQSNTARRIGLEQLLADQIIAEAAQGRELGGHGTA